MERRAIAWTAALLLLVSSARGAGGSGDESDPHGAPLTVLLADGERIRAVPLAIEGGEVRLRRGGETVRIALDRVKPVSVYLIKRRLMDLNSARTHLELGTYLASHDLGALAEREFDRAVNMDPSLRDEVAAARRGASSRTKPADPPAEADGESGKEDEPKELPKYSQASEEEIQRNREQALEWARRTRKTIVRSLHLVETPHFLIFSAWRRDNDKALAAICERMYKALCRQFDLPTDRSIWAGKCALYVFWRKEHYEQFVREISQRASHHPTLVQAGGYMGRKGSLTYIVLNRAREKTWFFELLVHEGTHAFLSNYISDRHVSDWANEGLAEYMAGEMVPGSRAAKNYIRQTKIAVRENREVSHIFEEVKLEFFDYGIAASLVRFMIAKNAKGFGEFIRLYKQGKSEAEALKEGFGATREELLKAWARFAARKYARDR